MTLVTYVVPRARRTPTYTALTGLTTATATSVSQTDLDYHKLESEPTSVLVHFTQRSLRGGTCADLLI